jgi:hypothetical protein
MELILISDRRGAILPTKEFLSSSPIFNRADVVIPERRVE